MAWYNFRRNQVMLRITVVQWMAWYCWGVLLRYYRINCSDPLWDNRTICWFTLIMLEIPVCNKATGAKWNIVLMKVTVYLSTCSCAACKKTLMRFTPTLPSISAAPLMQLLGNHFWGALTISWNQDVAGPPPPPSLPFALPCYQNNVNNNLKLNPKKCECRPCSWHWNKDSNGL